MNSHAHGHGHGHGHGVGQHAHTHHKEPGSLSRSFAIATALNVAFVVAEGVCGVIVNSTALLADAAHNLGDVFGLLLAWGAAAMARVKPSASHTYGLGKTTVLAAFANSLLLVAAIGAVAWEAIGRLSQAQSVPGWTMLFVALLGVVINTGSALPFIRGAKEDANLRGALLHLLVDAAVSLGVVFAGAVLIWRPQWYWVDPAVSLLISAVVLIVTWRLLKDTLHLSLDGVPPGYDLERVKASLLKLPGVIDVHDLHIWALSTSSVALTAHLVVDDATDVALSGRACACLEKEFGIGHSTVQLEPADQAQDCRRC